jgi:type II secretory pathway pseudopilin PulG
MKLNRTTTDCVIVTAYTLVEVVISIFVLSVMVISLYAGFSSGFAVVQLARENLRATQIMMQKMETVRLLKWSQLLDTNNFLLPTFSTYYDPGTTNSGAGGALYQGFVTAGSANGVSPDYMTNMRSVVVTIYWTNYPNGLAGTPIIRSRQMQTFVAKYGMQNYVYQ